MNIFIGDLKYITLTEAKDSSSILSLLSDDDITIFLKKAESAVNNLCNISETTTDIKKAIILLAECISKGEDNKRIVISEKRRGNSVTYDVKQTRYESMHYCMTEEIYFYLRPYMKGGFFKQVI